MNLCNVVFQSSKFLFSGVAWCSFYLIKWGNGINSIKVQQTNLCLALITEPNWGNLSNSCPHGDYWLDNQQPPDMYCFN